MSLYLVTITGADDSVEPERLCDLSESFSFVEWGILYSNSRAGMPRYPSLEWRRRLLALRKWRGFQVSRHLCGTIARGAMQGILASFAYHDASDRFQINGYHSSASLLERGELCKRLACISADREVILQCRTEDTLQQVANDAQSIQNASVLFDPSGGLGIEPLRWPPTPAGCRLGFAGGINPDNVLDVLKDIGPRDSFWIDMESGVRTAEKFDLEKVKSVLNQVAPFVRPR